MNSLFNPLFMIGVLFSMKYVNFHDPKVAISVKFTYICVQAVILFLLIFIRKRIFESKETGTVTLPASMSGNTPQTMSIKEYDTSQIKQLLNQTVFGTLITLFINYKWHVIQPLLVQSIVAPKNILTNPLFKIYIMGRKDASLARPFKSENPLMELLKQFQKDSPTEASNGPRPVSDDDSDKEEPNSPSTSAKKED
jgi:hypothetical protein